MIVHWFVGLELVILFGGMYFIYSSISFYKPNILTFLSWSWMESLYFNARRYSNILFPKTLYSLCLTDIDGQRLIPQVLFKSLVDYWQNFCSLVFSYQPIIVHLVPVVWVICLLYFSHYEDSYSHTCIFHFQTFINWNTCLKKKNSWFYQLL